MFSIETHQYTDFILIEFPPNLECRDWVELVPVIDETTTKNTRHSSFNLPIARAQRIQRPCDDGTFNRYLKFKVPLIFFPRDPGFENCNTDNVALSPLVGHVAFSDVNFDTTQHSVLYYGWVVLLTRTGNPEINRVLQKYSSVLVLHEGQVFERVPLIEMYTLSGITVEEGICVLKRDTLGNTYIHYDNTELLVSVHLPELELGDWCCFALAQNYRSNTPIGLSPCSISKPPTVRSLVKKKPVTLMLRAPGTFLSTDPFFITHQMKVFPSNWHSSSNQPRGFRVEFNYELSRFEYA
ncbi:hypothetical protein M3Y95_00013700 [Aphelenchoides besseyi]|nr:hypothetical protein M3Y95_00013700 [Aphelenchoides besseyi]